jgi:hypothetical protein
MRKSAPRDGLIYIRRLRQSRAFDFGCGAGYPRLFTVGAHHTVARTLRLCAMASASSSLFVPNTVGVSARGASSRPRVNGVSMPPRSRHTRVRRLAIASAPSDAGDGVGAYAVADTSEQRARGAAVCDEEFDTTTTTAVNLETSKESTDCPYTSLNASLGGILPTKSKVPIGGPTMLDNSVFFKSLLKAGSSPVGMPEAMLEWCDLTGQETVGIKNLVGPLCVSTIDPDIVEVRVAFPKSQHSLMPVWSAVSKYHPLPDLSQSHGLTGLPIAHKTSALFAHTRLTLCFTHLSTCVTQTRKTTNCECFQTRFGT